MSGEEISGNDWVCDCKSSGDFEKLHDPMCPLSPFKGIRDALQGRTIKQAIPVLPHFDIFTLRGLHTLRACKDAYVSHVLRAMGGNKTRAAEVLGIDRRNLYRILERIEAKK